ncbi:glycosylhydrolase-like jelly roll fold domain-containing protein [Catenuloplanes japonicus]|uniref:glycosylhydrolase-like jelly roll fold domain-containing protein n=1 Tax=Catenuloplanes japonicus TaxID=33876 RepID=UPI0005250C4F|nr:glycosylhydrolase-like jelly roll fold domain-containing protein [Catenuloplanes japonicus]
MRRALPILLAAVLVAGVPGVAHADAPRNSTNLSRFDPAAFRNPPKDSLPAIYWYWNNVITPEITDRQMAEMRAKGVYEAVIFPYGGDAMTPAFLTEEWFALVGHVLREAQRTGMRMWLFNDNNFPSGRAGGVVVNGGTVGDRTLPARPELRLKGLLRSTRIVDGPTTVSLAEASGLSVQNGALVVDPDALTSPAPLTPGAGWADYTATGKVTLTKGGVQLVVRASADGRSGYLVDVNERGVANVWRLDNGTRTQLSTGIATPGFASTRAQTVSVTVTGDTIATKINNTVQPVAVDGTYPRGAVAVSAEGTQRSQWDTLTVSSGSETLWGNDFSSAAALADFPGAATRLGAVTAAAARPLGSSDAVEVTGGTWRVPAGRWQLDVYAEALLRDDSSGYVRNYLDLLDPAATDAFLDAVPGEYLRRFPWAMGTVVPGFWDDEPFIASAQPHPFKRLPASPGLATAIRAAGGTPGLAYTAAADSTSPAAEGAYWRAVNNLFATSYYKRQADWLGKRGLKLITNPLLDEEGPQDRMHSTGDLSKNNQWAQVPGTDMITTDYAAGQQTTLGRNAASAAHQSGAPRVVMETFGNAGWQIAPEFMHATVGALAARGANLTFLHAMWTDEQVVNFPPPFGPRSTFWNDMPDVDAWIGRVAELGRGTNLARTALVQPQAAAERTRTTDTAHTLDHDLSEAAFALERGQVDFDLLSDASLSGDPAARYQAVARGDTLRVGRATYELVVVPRTPYLDRTTIQRLRDFARGGGHVISVGNPDLFGGTGGSWHTYGRGAVASVEAEAALGALAVDSAALRLSPAADAVRVLRTGRGADTAYLLVNESAAPVVTTAGFDERGVPEIWDPRTGATGTSTAYRADRDRVSVPITLDPYETIGVVFRAGVHEVPHLADGTLTAQSVSVSHGSLRATVLATAPGSYTLTGQSGRDTFRGTVTVTDPLTPIPLAGPWTVRLERDGATAVERPLGSWTGTDPTFSGSAVYRTTVAVTAKDLAGRRMTLDLGDVRDLATVTVNGRVLPAALWRPYTVDVTDVLRPGTNTIGVRVTNTLANSRNKILPSGLLGPVVLRPAAVVTAPLKETR